MEKSQPDQEPNPGLPLAQGALYHTSRLLRQVRPHLQSHTSYIV